MMKIKFLLGCILLFCCFAPGLRAQDTAFWFAAPHMSETLAMGIPLNRPAFLAISNGTEEEAHITIMMYNGGIPRTITKTIAAGGLYRHHFNTTLGTDETPITYIENPRGSAGNVVTYGMHITSDVRVTAYYMMNHTESRDIFTLKGHQALGTLFYVPMQSDNAAVSAGTWGGLDQIDIVATEDGTSVTVIPKAEFRTGAGGTTRTAAGTTITRLLNKGQTLKIMEYDWDENPSLAGTEISATNPIAVTVTEDLVGGDTSGDQIVPVSSLGKRYIVPRGYRTVAATSNVYERIYLGGTVNGTTVNIYNGVSTVSPITLNAGQVTRYTFPADVDAISVDATQPIYLYQRSGYGEEGAALLPSLYSIGQTRMSFYQVGGVAVQKGFLIFRTGTESGFKIAYGSGSLNTLSLTPLNIPNVAEWKIARFDYSAPPTAGQVVRIESSQSPFSLGYITGDTRYNDSYGYFSAFGDFEFPEGDTTYMCGSSEVLQGGYAVSYQWFYDPPGTPPHTVLPATTPFATTSSITATEEGRYTLVMDQDPDIVMATTYLKKVNAGSISPGEQTICTGTAAASLSVSGDTPAPGTTYQWQKNTTNPDDPAGWTDIASATAVGYDPGTLTSTTWYRRGMSSDKCLRAYTYPVRVRVSSCTLPVNPHLMGRFRGN